MPYKYCIWFSIAGDLRFLSHHDMMRLMERLVVRSRLPLRYSQGFNPRPVMSLACPRPVGVVSDQELLVLSLNEQMSPEGMLAAVNSQAPCGMRFDRAETIAGKSARSTRVEYRCEVSPSISQAIGRRLDQLRDMPAWEIQRLTSSNRRNEPMKSQQIDIKPMVVRLELEGEVLQFALEPRGDMWARPGEVLRLAGLDERIDLAACKRTNVVYETGSNNT